MGLERWPDIAADVAKAPPCQSVCKALTPQPTWVINGKHLTSGYDRTGEAETQVMTVPPTATEAWCYGHALGDAVTQLLMRRADDGSPQLQTVHVVIMSRSITGVVAELDPCGWLGHPRVQLHLARDLDRVHAPFVVSPVELHGCDEDAEPLRDRVTVLLNVEYNEMNLQARRHVELAQYEENKAALASDPPVSALYGTADRPAVVIGGGPTVAEAYDWLRERAYSHVIVSCSAALKPLLAAGITPHVVLVVDPSHDMARHFEGIAPEQTARTTLVYIPSTFPAVVSGWGGPRASANVWVNHDGGDLVSGGSVVHAAMDLAVKMGARDVTLVGLDFCYPGNQSHVEGAPVPYAVTGDDQLWRERTRNGLGEMCLTDSLLMQYRRVAEDIIAMYPSVTWHRLGRRGVPLRGAAWT